MKPNKKLLVGLAGMALLSACTDPDLIAQVGDKGITEPEFQAYLNLKRIPGQDEGQVERALESYLQREALARAIEKEGLVNREQVAAELADFRRQLLISRHFEQHLKDAVDEEAVATYYANHRDDYRSQSARAAHILIRVDTRMSESERDAKRTQAHELYSRLQAGEDFADLAKEHSEDKVSAQKGGELGWLQRGAVAPEFSEQLFELETGEISEPFLTAFGFHIVKLLEAPKTVTRPLEAVAGDIRYQLRNQVKQAETERLLDTIRVKRHDTD